MASVSIPLVADRLPAQVEPDVRAAADMDTALICRKLHIDLKKALYHFAPFLVGGIERKLSAALTAERGTGQLIAGCRNDARDLGVIDPAWLQRIKETPLAPSEYGLSETKAQALREEAQRLFDEYFRDSGPVPGDMTLCDM